MTVASTLASVSPKTSAISFRTGARQGALYGLNSGLTRCTFEVFLASSCSGV